MRSSNVRELAEVLLPLPQGRESAALPTIEIWFHSSCLTNAAAGEEVDHDELSSVVGHVKAMYGSK